MLIEFGERSSNSPYLSCIWESQSSRDGEFLSVAYPQWEIVFSRIAGKLGVFLRGAVTFATKKSVPGDGSWVGLRFRSGTVMAGLDYNDLRDADFSLPVVGGNSFLLAGMAWKVPTFENADDFVTRLVRRGLIASDPLVSAAMAGEVVDGKKLRQQQRRFIKSTGLSKQTIATIERAQIAARMLRDGNTISDTVAAAGFSDQSHLTRSLKRFIGLTPGQMLSTKNEVQLSFIPKPNPNVIRAKGWILS
jgi:AraC-like DNA-binding protein